MNDIWIRHTAAQDAEARRRELRTPYRDRTVIEVQDTVFRELHACINARSLGNGGSMKLALLPDETLS